MKVIEGGANRREAFFDGKPTSWWLAELQHSESRTQ